MAFNMRLISVFVPILWINFAHISHASNILVVPVAGEGSHFSIMSRIAKELTNRGHNITMLVNGNYEDDLTSPQRDHPFKFEFFKPNFTRLEFQDMLKNMTNAALEGRYYAWMVETLRTTDFLQRQISECLNILGDTELISKLRFKFDLAIVDVNLNCPVLQYFWQYTKLQYVVISPTLAIPTSVLLENRFPCNPSFMPDITTGLDHRMSFLERITNGAISLFFFGIISAVANPYQSAIPEDVSLSHSNAELWLINTNFALDFPKPMMPNSVLVGGLTTTPAQPLGHEWEEFLQSAGKDGVVLFSMGSYARGIDKDIAAMFAGAFAQLPQKVIWKLNGQPSATLTPNVKVVDWMPQNDLLGHPQIKVFIYHCGLNGVWEAVYHGVPMVAVPLFGDQPDNAQRIVSRGMGVKVDITTLTSDELADAIRTVINDPSFKRNATRISSIFRDTPRTPVQLAGDWLEYVIRHGGAKHLRSAALDLNLFQYLLLDVILVLLIAFIIVVVIALWCCKLCLRGCRKMCGSSKKEKSE